MYLAVDENGTEVCFREIPYRSFYSPVKNVWLSVNEDAYVDMPTGTIEKLLGRPLSWEDEPVELK